MPTQQRLNELFDYNAETGLLTWKIKTSKKVVVGREAGAISGRGYKLIGLGSRNYKYGHCIAWTMVHGPIPDKMYIDHINGNRADNRLHNLRMVTHSVNHRNSKLYRSNRSGHPGVYRRNDHTWLATIRVQGKNIYLGSYRTYQAAVQSRRTAEAANGFHRNHGRIEAA